MFGLTRREQRWKAEQKAAEALLPVLAATVQAVAQVRVAEANTDARELERLRAEVEQMTQTADFYKRRCDELQKHQSQMRDPERTIVCDILANGFLLPTDYAGERYKVPNAQDQPGRTG